MKQASNMILQAGRRWLRAIAPFLSVFAVLGLFLLAALPADAAPKVGSSRPDIKLVDGWDRVNDLSKLDRPLLLFYEGKDSSKQNQALKDDLAALEKSKHYRKVVAHLVVADVSDYDYWPARGIAKGELQKWSNKTGFVIYSDFTGEVRTKLGLERGKSNVVFYAKNGKVMFSKAGALSDVERAELLRIVRETAGAVSG